MGPMLISTPFSFIGAIILIVVEMGYIGLLSPLFYIIVHRFVSGITKYGFGLRRKLLA
jgi:hypothetical protein